jgi:hypothetical protein
VRLKYFGGFASEEAEMATAKKKQTAVKAKKKTKTTPKAVKKAPVKKVVKGAPKKKTALKKTARQKVQPKKTRIKPKVRKLKKYSPRSRYATFRVGDRLVFERIQNWDSDQILENIVGIVVEKIEEKGLGLRFIEVQFDLRDLMPFLEDGLRLRRYVVK